jgi:hypothetical protein
MRVSIFVLVLVMSAFAYSQSATTPVDHERHEETSDARASGVDTSGDHAMGFFPRTIHSSLRLLQDGGAIDVTANDPNDTVTRDEIRNHLSHIARMFMNGNFQVPMFILLGSQS